jgi:hypothetical protein
MEVVMTRSTPERSFGRRVAGLSLIVAPALLMLANAIDPGASDRADTRLSQIGAHPTRYIAAAYLLLIAAWAFVPGLIALWRLFEGPRVTMGQLGSGLMLIGTVTTIAFFGMGVYEYEAAKPGLDHAQMARLVDNAEGAAVASPLLVVFLLGVVVGSLILAWSLWRRRIVPVWSPVAIIVGTILNFLADGAAISAIAFGFQLVGFGWVGLRLLTTPRDEWARVSRTSGDLAPAGQLRGSS